MNKKERKAFLADENSRQVMLDFAECVRKETMVVAVKRVSPYGDSRTMSFVGILKEGDGYRRLKFDYAIAALTGWREGMNGGVIVKGGGMDMVFYTLNTMMRILENEGIIIRNNDDAVHCERYIVL